MSQCQTCGGELGQGARFCANCGAAVLTPGVQMPLAPGAATVVVQPRAAPGSPGIGVAGFVLVIVGLFVPFVGLLGLILSIVGYRQAKREGLSTGLSIAGTIIGVVATIIGMLILLLLFAAIGTTTTSTSGSSVMQLLLLTGATRRAQRDPRLSRVPQGLSPYRTLPRTQRMPESGRGNSLT